MCGVVGLVDQKGVDKNLLVRMSNTLIHRGPDDAGVWMDDSGVIGLGHRRLSIIDLSQAGRQPMSDSNRDVCVVFNGEIYNFQELRQELEKKGYKFRTRTDTEVIIYSYKEWGIKCLDKFNGMFALAICDKEKNQMVLVRDRLGKKPLYYYSAPGIFMFASELKALMAHPIFSKEISEEGLVLYFTFGYIPAPFSIFSNTYKLPPGCYLLYDLDTGATKIEKYWDPRDAFLNSSKINLSEEEAQEEVENLLQSAAKYRLIADVPVGVLLSGGIDSSLVAAIASKLAPGIQTFSVGFREKKYDEAPFAKNIAQSLGTNHHEFYVFAKDTLGILEKLPEIYDEPFADSSALPTYLISKLARQHVKVVLTGDGGDELFWGYRTYFHFKKLLKLSYIPFILRGPTALALSSFFSGKWKRRLHLLSYSSPDEIYFSLISGDRFWELKKFLTIKARPRPQRLLNYERFKKFFEETPLETASLFDLCYPLPDDYLVKVDRATMFNSLEARSPFLDYRLVEYALRLPLKFKFQRNQSKYLVKKILSQYLPKGMWDRPKKGFACPAGEWLRGSLQELLFDNIRGDVDFIDVAYIRNLAKAHVDGKADCSEILWPFLIFKMGENRWLK